MKLNFQKPLHQLLNGRLLGHPIHPMLVHFPTALFSSSLLFDLAGLWLSKPTLYAASFYCIGTGLAGGTLAAAFGLVDYVRLKNRQKLFQKASLHALLQFSVLILFAVVFGLRYERTSELAAPEITEIAVSGLGVLAMIVGNYLGGDLVFRYGVGVNADPSDRNGRPEG
ncbi:MAG: DUF2231 domain-containing protein [Balneolaceae bacterium]|nr:DUF2231 domain-containing protein [Balneolaceae bacterium]